MADWCTVRVPHRPQRSFDVAWCVCGWLVTDDDTAVLDLLVEMHSKALANHLITVEECDVS